MNKFYGQVRHSVLEKWIIVINFYNLYIISKRFWHNQLMSGRHDCP